MDETRNSQRMAVYRFLKDGNTLTQREALANMGILRLASRINELKEQGVPVEKKMIEVPMRNGKTTRVAQYYIRKEEERETL